MSSTTKPILIALDDHYGDTTAPIRQLADTVRTDFDIYGVKTFAGGQRIARELCSNPITRQQIRAVLLDMEFDGERHGDDYIAFLRGELRLGVPIVIVSGYSRRRMNSAAEKRVRHNGCFVNEEGKGFFGNCFYFSVHRIGQVAEKLKKFQVNRLTPMLTEEEMADLYRNSDYFHQTKREKAKAFRQQILTPFERLATALQAFYSGHRDVFQRASVHDAFVQIDGALVGSQEAFENLIALPNPDYQSYPRAKVEKYVGFYSNYFLGGLVEALKNQTVRAFLDENERTAKRVIDFIIDDLSAKIEAIVKFIEGEAERAVNPFQQGVEDAS